MTKAEETNRREKSGNERALVSVLKGVRGILGTEANVPTGWEEMTSASSERVDKTCSGPHVNQERSSIVSQRAKMTTLLILLL